MGKRVDEAEMQPRGKESGGCSTSNRSTIRLAARSAATDAGANTAETAEEGVGCWRKLRRREAVTASV